MYKRQIVTAVVVVCFVLIAGYAIADPTHDEFGIVLGFLDPLGEMPMYEPVQNNTGYTDPTGAGPWFEYPEDPAPDTNWWVNQWFYDDPTDPDRYKIIDVWLNIVPLDPTYFDLGGAVLVTLNWTNQDWTDTGPDGSPPMGDQEQYIERADPILIDLPQFEPNDITDHAEFGIHYEIPDFNPEWVSIDISLLVYDPSGFPVSLFAQPGVPVVQMTGWIEHECLPIPEPGSLCLLALGIAGLVMKSRGRLI